MGQLLDDGANVSCAGPYGNTPLLCAAWAGHEDAVRFLIERGADPNSRAHDDATALYAAVARRHPSMAALLIEAGADANIGRKHGHDRQAGEASFTPPLHCAIAHRDEATARLLIDAGAYTNDIVRGRDALRAAKAHGLDELATYIIAASHRSKRRG